jgi:hypothetical protein
MERTYRLARRNAKKESPRAARLAKFRDMRALTIRDDIFRKHHRDSYIHYVYMSLNLIFGNSLAAPKWKKDMKQFPKDTYFKYNDEEWWISCHGFIAKDDGLVKGWVHEDGTVHWIKVIPDKLKCFIWV